MGAVINQSHAEFQHIRGHVEGLLGHLTGVKVELVAEAQAAHVVFQGAAYDSYVKVHNMMEEHLDQKIQVCHAWLEELHDFETHHMAIADQSADDLEHAAAGLGHH